MALGKKFNGEDKIIANKSVIDHNELANRDAYGSHSISAIRKLPEKLTDLKNRTIANANAIAKEIEDRIADVDAEESRAINREDAIEDNAQRISLVDNNNGTLTFTNYDNVSNTVKSGHLVDDTTIKEINDHSTLEVIGVKGTFEKNNQSITKVYDAEDIYDDIKSSEQISLTAQLDNGNNPTGKLLFKDYSGVVTEVQGGFLPDDDTIELSNNKLSIKQVYVDNDTIVGDGSSSADKLNAKAIKDSNGTITVSDINEMNQEIQAIEGRGGYLRPYDFQTASPDLPTDDLTAQPPIYSLLTQYALQEISNITNPTEIFNGTRVTNLYNNHTWILNNTQDTNPIVFEWVDLGQSLVSVATNDTLGVVKGSDQDLEGSVDVNGVITINGLSQELSDLDTNKQDVMQVSTMPNAGVDYLNKVFQFIGTTGTYTNSYFYKCILDSNDNLYKWIRVDVQPATPLVWGNITGTLSNQTDLQNALNTKQDVIDSSHKLDADLVDDSNSTNKFVTTSEKNTWSGKQDALVSGTNIKTINNGSLLGSGNINLVNDVTINGNSIVSGNDAIIPITQVATIPIDSSVTSGSSNPISGGAVYTALSGKEDISNKVTSLSNQSTNTEYPSAKVVYDNLQTKQDSLVSGSSIKTLNSQSLLGSGNINAVSDVQMGGSSIVSGTTATIPTTAASTISIDTTVTQNSSNLVSSGAVYTSVNTKLDKKPDGTNDLISNNKVSTTYLPDYILGQVIYGGNVTTGAVATLDTNAQSKLGTSSSSITLTNDTTAITGYAANNGIYYIATADFTFASLNILTGDWLISNGNAWTKIDNTDAVTGVRGNAENSYRVGNVELDPDDFDDTNSTNKFVSTTEKSTWSGKQDALVSGTNIKTINNTSILGSGDITITGETSTINIGDKLENIYINNHIDKSVVDTLLSNLPYTEDVDLPDGQGGVITITSCGRYLIEGTVKINGDTYTMDPIIYAAECSTLGDYFGISDCTGHAIVAGYGSKLIYLEYDTPENRQLCDLFGFTISGAGFTDVESFNIFELLAETYGEIPDYSSNYDNGLTVTSVYSSAKSFTDLLVAKYPNTFTPLVTKEDLKVELTTKQDVVNIITSSSDTSATLTLANNTSYRYTNSSGLTSLSLTVSSPADNFNAEVVFISGSTATTFTDNGIDSWSGDGVSSNTFTPEASKTYNIIIWYDGINVNAITRGA